MFSDPAKNLKTFGLKEDDIVVDLGAGTGFYSVAAGGIASRGKVYAIEIQKDFLGTIKDKVDNARLKNVEIIWGNIEKIGGTKIGDGVASVAIVSDVLFQVEDRETFVREIKRILKAKGRVLFVDWSESSIMNGANLVPKEKALALFEKSGFVLEREINVGDYHYGMILIKS